MYSTILNHFFPEELKNYLLYLLSQSPGKVHEQGKEESTMVQEAAGMSYCKLPLFTVWPWEGCLCLCFSVFTCLMKVLNRVLKLWSPDQQHQSVSSGDWLEVHTSVPTQDLVNQGP